MSSTKKNQPIIHLDGREEFKRIAEADAKAKAAAKEPAKPAGK